MRRSAAWQDGNLHRHLPETACLSQPPHEYPMDQHHRMHTVTVWLDGEGCCGCSSRRHWPARVQCLDNTHGVQVACGWRHTVVVDAEGRVFSFGWNKYGQLGHGTTV